MTRLLNKLNIVAQKRLVRKPWDKMLFDMRMELGKGHYENLSIQYTENFVSINLKIFIGRVLIILKCLLKTFIVGTH